MQSQSQETMDDAEIFMQGVLDNFTVTQRRRILNKLVKKTINKKPAVKPCKKKPAVKPCKKKSAVKPCKKKPASEPQVEEETKKPKDCPGCGVPMNLSFDYAYNAMLINATRDGVDGHVDPCEDCCCLSCGGRKEEWDADYDTFKCC